MYVYRYVGPAILDLSVKTKTIFNLTNNLFIKLDIAYELCNDKDDWKQSLDIHTYIHMDINIHTMDMKFYVNSRTFLHFFDINYIKAVQIKVLVSNM